MFSNIPSLKRSDSGLQKLRFRSSEDLDKLKSRVIVISYRLPITMNEEGNIVNLEETIIGTKNSTVGSAIQSLKEEGRETVWIGYPGFCPETEEEKERIRKKLFDEYHFIPVFIDPETARKHFTGFCKQSLFPLFHYYNIYEASVLCESDWQAYCTTNELFAETLTSYIGKDPREHPDFICIQDYHLSLLPSLLRDRQILSKIGIFFHVPWPSSEVYRSLAVRKEVLSGILGADLVGFQTFAHVRHFLSNCTRLMGLPIQERGILIDGHFVKVECIPTGIDSESLLKSLDDPKIKESCEKLRNNFKGKKVIVSRDRMEYIKGIPHKLRAFRDFLELYPDMRDKVVLIQDCRPNPDITDSSSYHALTEEIETMVGAINGAYSTVTHCPIQYSNKKNPIWEEATALFAVADCCLITSLRDGMNLTSHEFAIATGKNSPIILSEFTGSAHCLSGALLINPWDEMKVAHTIYKALNMSEDEKQIRASHNRSYVLKNSAHHWMENFLRELTSSKRVTDEAKPLKTHVLADLKQKFSQSSKRIILCELEGTIIPNTLSIPSQAIFATLKELTQNENNQVWLISGRNRDYLNHWFSNLPIGLVSEDSHFFKRVHSNEWENFDHNVDLSWINLMKPIFDDYCDSTPGSQLEVNERNIVWYYRGVDPVYGEYQKNNLLLHIQGLPKLPIELISGTDFLQVRLSGVNKGVAVKKILEVTKDVDFAICFGDETMFEEIRKHPIPYSKSIIVSPKTTTTSADYFMAQSKVLKTLHELAQC